MEILKADDVAKFLKVSKSQAYIVIRQLNKELKNKGCLTLRGRISKEYLTERMQKGKA